MPHNLVDSRADAGEELHDPYKKVREKVQQQVNSGHFEACVKLIQSVVEQHKKQLDESSKISPPSSTSIAPLPLFQHSAIATEMALGDSIISPSQLMPDSPSDVAEAPDSHDPDSSSSLLPNPPPNPHQHHYGGAHHGGTFVAKGNHNQLLKRPLLNPAADLSFGPLHESVLLSACAQGVTSAVTRLLRLGANPDRPNAKGLTPLMKSAGAGHGDCVKILVDFGVDLFAVDLKGQTALDWARLSGRGGCAPLLEAAMEESIAARRAAEFGRIKQEELQAIVDGNAAAYRAIEAATEAGDLAALMSAVDSPGRVDRRAYLETLTALGQPTTPPTVPFFVDVETVKGSTPLMLACAQADVSAVERLLEWGAKKDIENRRGHTALSWTAVCGHHHVVRALLSGGVDAFHCSRLENKTALIHAAYNGTNQCVEMLLDHYFEHALDRRYNLSKKQLSKTEEWDMNRNWLKPFEKVVLHKDIYGKTALDWSIEVGLVDTITIMKAAHDRITKRHEELAREDALAQSVPCRLGCGYVDRADRIEKHEVQRCPRRIVGCESCGKNIPANTIVEHETDHCPKRIVRCENRYRGCEEKLPFDEVGTHQTHRCMYRRNECRLCHKSLLHHQRDEHEAELCPNRNITCDLPTGLGCGGVLKAHELRDHCKHHCVLRQVKCRVGCGSMFPQKELQYHEEQICVQPCSWEGCGLVIGPDDVRSLHEVFLCPRRVVRCPNCPIGGLVACRLDTHMQHMCPKRRVLSVFDLEATNADERAGYEEVERGECPERLQRCRLNYIGRRLSVRNKAKKMFETATVVHYREADDKFKIQHPDGFKWEALSDLDFVIADDTNWECGWIGHSVMGKHMIRDCPNRAVMCNLGCGQRIFERGRLKHETDNCPKRMIICPLGCKGKMRAEDEMEHTENICEVRDVLCGSCGLSVALPKLEEHMRTTCSLARSRCPKGCGKELTMGKVEIHIEEECPKRLVTCKLCNDSSLFADELQLHLVGELRDQECIMRSIPCELCGTSCVAKDMELHIANQCERRIIVCDCGKEIVAETKSDHRILECPAVIRYCSLGCGRKLRVMDMNAHQRSDCSKRHLLEGKLRLCTLGCGNQVSGNEQFIHMTSLCPKRIVECEYLCPEVVSAEERDSHKLVCRFRKVSCGANSKVCLRQVRSWFAESADGKKNLVACENHTSNCLLYAIQEKEIRLIEYILDETENRGLEFETPFGDTPLTKAAEIGSVEIVGILVERARIGGLFISDFVNHETCRGKTALIEAAKGDHPDVIKLLVAKRAQIDYVTKFYHKTAVDWAANSKSDKALDELLKALKVEQDINKLFIKIATGDVDFVKNMTRDGEHYRRDHIRSIYKEIEAAKEESKIYVAEVVQNENNIVLLEPEVERLHKHLEVTESHVKGLNDTALSLRTRAKDLANKLQAGFSNSIIAVQACGVAEVNEVMALTPPTEEILQVVKALCLLKEIEPQGVAAASRDVPASMKRPVSREKSGRPQADMAELMGYWRAGAKLLKAKNLSHQLRYYTKSKIPAKALEQITTIIMPWGFLDYDIKYGLFLELEVDGRETQRLLKSREAKSRGKSREDADSKKEPDSEEDANFGGGFQLIAALSKWIKATVLYATTVENLEDTKRSEILFQQEHDTELLALKRERVEVEIATFRLNLLGQEVEDAKGRVKWAERRITGGESKVQVAKLFNMITPSGHSLLSWAAACGQSQMVEFFLDHGAFPGYGEEFTEMCVKVIQSVYRFHRWLVTRAPWCKEYAREYRNREMENESKNRNMLDYMKKLRSRVRMPLTEAFYNGHYKIADVFERKKTPMYHACQTNIMPAGSIPRLGDPAGNEFLDKSMNIVDCAKLGKERFQCAVWVHGYGWEPPNCRLDPFARGEEHAEELWAHVKGVVDAGKKEMLKRRAVRQEKKIRNLWGVKLDEAIRKGDFPQMVFCAQKGAMIDYQTEAGITPLLRAAMEDVHKVNHVWCINEENKKVTAISYLLDRITKRPMIDFETNIGHTALTFASYHSRLEAIEALLERGCSIDKRVRAGKTALIYAAMNGKADVIKLLLERGADPFLKDDDGKTANDWAFERNFSECLAMLARERLGNKGGTKAATGEADSRKPCCWGCGVLATKVELSMHEMKCEYRNVSCQYCSKDDLQAREKNDHELKECTMRPIKCWLCYIPMLQSDLMPHIASDCTKRLVKCEYCDDDIRFDKLEDHRQNICKKRMVDCPNECDTRVPFDSLTSHKRSLCPMRRVRCTKGCGQEMWAKQRDEHETKFCVEAKIPCEFCHISWLSRYLPDHVLKCEQAPVKCPNHQFGCKFKGIARIMKKHLDFACDFTFNRPCPLGCMLKLREVDLKEHVKKCVRRDQICDLCGETIIFAQVDVHATYECIQRSVPCGLCGASVPVLNLDKHKELSCEQRSTLCSNNACYLKLPLAKMANHEKFTCRRAIVFCRQGCGNTMYLEKRQMHEDELCDCRFVKCPMCDESIREKSKWDHMEIECLRRPK